MKFLQSWHCTHEARLGEPMLVLRTTEGQELVVMLPAAAAEQLGLALVAEGRQAAPSGRPH
jgi:hypothetical protein